MSHHGAFNCTASCLLYENLDVFQACTGQCHAEEPHSFPVYKVFVVLFLVCCSAFFAGMTLGYLPLTIEGLAIMISAGNPKEKEYARTIMPLRKRGNLLLCTLLLGNTLCNSLIAIFSAELTSGPWYGYTSFAKQSGGGRRPHTLELHFTPPPEEAGPMAQGTLRAQGRGGGPTDVWTGTGDFYDGRVTWSQETGPHLMAPVEFKGTWFGGKIAGTWKEVVTEGRGMMGAFVLRQGTDPGDLSAEEGSLSQRRPRKLQHAVGPGGAKPPAQLAAQQEEADYEPPRVQRGAADPDPMAA